MASVMQSAASSPYRCMKYKRKYYHAADYLPPHVTRPEQGKVHDPDVKTDSETSGINPKTDQDVDSATIQNADVASNPTEMNNNIPPLDNFCRQTHDFADTVDIGADSPNKRQKMTPESRDVALFPDTYSPVDEATPIDAPFQNGIEGSTQDMCMTLLNMNFNWRPDSSPSGSTTTSRNDTLTGATVSASLPTDPAVFKTRHSQQIQQNYSNCSSESNLFAQPWNQNSGSRILSECQSNQNAPSRTCDVHSDPGEYKLSQSPADHHAQNNIAKLILLPIVTIAGNNKDTGHNIHTSNCVYEQNSATTQPKYNNVHASSVDSLVGAITDSHVDFPQQNYNDPDRITQCSIQPEHRTVTNHAGTSQTGHRILEGTTVAPLFQTTGTRHVEPDTTMSHQAYRCHVTQELAPKRRCSLEGESDCESTSTISNISVGSTSSCPPKSPDSLMNYPGVKKSTSLFPRAAKGRTLWEIVDMMSRRHRDNYYIGWSAEKILDLPPDERPNVFPVTSQLKKDLVSKSVLTENKKLAFSFLSSEHWGHTFRQNLRNGVYKTLSDAKRDASQLWRENCPEYDGSRAVRMRDNQGNIVMKRTRQQSGSEFEYRQNLRKAKVNLIVDQIWAKRSVIADAFQSKTIETLSREMRQEMSDYQTPPDRIAQMADVIAFSLRKELLAANMDRIT